MTVVYYDIISCSLSSLVASCSIDFSRMAASVLVNSQGQKWLIQGVHVLIKWQSLKIVRISRKVEVCSSGGRHEWCHVTVPRLRTSEDVTAGFVDQFENACHALLVLYTRKSECSRVARTNGTWITNVNSVLTSGITSTFNVANDTRLKSSTTPLIASFSFL